MTTGLLEICDTVSRCGTSILAAERAKLFLRKNLAVFLCCLGAATYVNGVIRCKIELVFKLHQQFIAAFDRDHRTPRFLANPKLGRMAAGQAARGDLEHS